MKQYIRIYLQPDGVTVKHIHTNSNHLGDMEPIIDENAPLAIDIESDIDNERFIEASEMYDDIVKMMPDHKPVFGKHRDLKNMRCKVLQNLHKRF